MKGFYSTLLAIAVFFFWGIWLYCNIVASQELCRELDFVGVFKDKAFNKSIIRNVTVQDEELCQWKCFLDDTCKSYNLGPPVVSEKGKRVCELSSSHHVSHPGYLVSRPGFIYRLSLNPCDVSCPEKQSCLSVDNTGRYSCLCPDPGFKGNTCNEDIDECVANTHGCAAEANCINTAGSFICTCLDGYQGNGKTCKDKDECLTNEHNCNSAEVCTNTIGSFTCSCSPDAIQDGDACVGFPFHWKLDGTDKLLNLSGDAKFENQDGIKVLYLDGNSLTYAETPAIPIHSTDLTIAVWIKVPISPSNVIPIYADWSVSPSFAFGSTTKLCAAASRAVGNDFVYNTCSSETVVEKDIWVHVAWTWKRGISGKLKMYANGKKTFEHAADGNQVLDIKNSGRSVFDIGFRKDTGETIPASLSDLVIFNRVLSELEIKHDLFENHALTP